MALSLSSWFWLPFVLYRRKWLFFFVFLQREHLSRGRCYILQSCRSVVSGSLSFTVSSHDGWRRRSGSHDSRDVISPRKEVERVFKHRSRGRRRGGRQFLNKQTSGTTIHPRGGKWIVDLNRFVFRPPLHPHVAFFFCLSRCVNLCFCAELWFL